MRNSLSGPRGKPPWKPSGRPLATPAMPTWTDCSRLLNRHFGAKPDQKICRRSGGDAEFMEDPLHGRLNGIVVEIDGLWIVCAARGSEWLSGGEQGFDGFVVEDEERGHRLETGLHRLVAASVADPADDVLAAEFLQIIGGGAGTVL